MKSVISLSLFYLQMHLLPGTVEVITVRLFHKSSDGGCWTLDFLGPLHSASANLTSIFMASANRVTEIVHPVMIPFSDWRNSDVTGAEPQIKVVIIIHDEVLDVGWDMKLLRCCLHKLLWY